MSGVALVPFVTFLAGRLYAEGSPALTAVIGDIPNVIVADFKHGGRAVFTVAAINTVFTGSAVFTVNTVFTGSAVLSGVALVPFVTFLAGRLYAEGSPRCAVVI